MTSAQDVYLNSSAPVEAPTASGWEMMWNWATGNWDERNRQYREALKQYDAQKLLNAAQWEREDTAYQRLVADLQKAGINPYYALNNNSLSPVSSSAQEVGTSKSSSKKEKESSHLSGLLTAALLIIKLLA